jgi:polysaccharide pyruvyl transferase CsaB
MKIAISGWYGNNNVGDEAILRGTLLTLRKQFEDAEFVVFSDNPEHTRYIYQVDSFYQWPVGLKRNIFAFMRLSFWIYLVRVAMVIRNTDLFVLGGGGLLQHDNFGVVGFWLSKLLIAQLLRKPTVMYAIGVGRVKRKLDKMLIRILGNRTDLITVRDKESEKNLLDYYKVRKTKVVFTADNAFAIHPPEIFSHKNAAQALRARIGIVLLPLWSVGIREDVEQRRLDSIIIETVERIVNEFGHEVIFISENFREDTKNIERIWSGIKNHRRVSVDTTRFTTEQNMEFISKLDVLVSMRLHPLILASLVRTPFVGVIAHAKIEGFLSQMSQQCMGVPYDAMTAEMLCNRIKYALENSRCIRCDIERCVESLAYKAMLNGELLKQVVGVQ